MFYKQVDKIEETLRSKKTKTPEDIKNAKNDLMKLKNQKKITKEALTNIKIHYQSHLASAPTASNYVAVGAIAVSLFTGLFSLISSIQNINDDLIVGFFSSLTAIILILLFLLMYSFSTMSKKCVSYTIMIGLIDEILKLRDK